MLKFFERECPFYISVGMTWEQYWNGDPAMVRAYRRAERMRADRANRESHLQGMYIYDALCRVAPAFNALAKDHTPLAYPERPYELLTGENRRITGESSDNSPEKTQMERMKQMFEVQAAAVNIKLEREMKAQDG